MREVKKKKQKQQQRSPPPSSHLVHDEDEQGQQQQPGQDGQSHHPSRDGPRGLAHPHHRQADGGAVGRQLRREVLVGHLDDAEGGAGADHVGAVLVLRLRDGHACVSGRSQRSVKRGLTFRKVSTARRE